MTALTTTNASLYAGDDLSAAGYSDKEINLIGHCWHDSQTINKEKTGLAFHLWDLKQEMESAGSIAHESGAGKPLSRFWAAFDAGHLPLTGDKGRASINTCLTAVKFLKRVESEYPINNLYNILRTLSPSTIHEISLLEGQSQELVYKSLTSSDFIGTAAVRLLAKEAQQDVFDKLFAWVDDHPDKPVTPKTIRALRAAVVDETAQKQIVDTPQAFSTEKEFSELISKIGKEAPKRDHEAKVEAVKKEIARPDREHQERIEEHVIKYNEKLLNAHTAVHDLLLFLRSVDRIDGTQYLDEMRCSDVKGLITVNDDLPRIKKIGEELMTLARLANSSNPPTGIDMTTYTVDAE